MAKGVAEARTRRGSPSAQEAMTRGELLDPSAAGPESKSSCRGSRLQRRGAAEPLARAWNEREDSDRPPAAPGASVDPATEEHGGES
eukprot:15438797-Alexandrium_andersonii.AAC.1